MRWVVGIVVCVACAAASGSARACTGPWCEGGIMLPRGGTVPENMPVLSLVPHDPWGPLLDIDTLAARLRVERTDGAGTVAVPVTMEMTEALTDPTYGPHVFVVRPVEGQFGSEGDRLHVVVPDDCVRMSYEGTFDVALGPPAAPPTGPLEVRISDQDTALLWVSSNRGDCEGQIGVARATVTAVVTEADRAWLPAMRFRTLVDGEPWVYRPSWFLDLRDHDEIAWGSQEYLVYAACDRSDTGRALGLTEGTHQVAMEAWVPELGMVLRSPEETVELRCDTSRLPLLDASVPDAAALDGGPASDASVPDASVSRVDASAMEVTYGCGCSAGAGSMAGASPVVLVLLSLLAIGRVGPRRRRRSCAVRRSTRRR